MKKYFYLFLMLPVLAFGQVKNQNYDYFVQFNSQQFAKKANIDSLFNHKALKSFNKKESKFKLNDFMSFIDKSKPVTIHGSFTDSIPYYQISLPLIDQKGLQQFIQNKMDQAKANDSIVETIKSYPKYQIYSPSNDNYTLAWNNNSLVVYGISENNDYNPYEDTLEVIDTAAVVVDTVAAVEEYVVDETAPAVVDAAPMEEIVVEADAPTDGGDEESDEEYNEEYYAKLEEENRKEREKERLEKQAKQEVHLALMFEEGFVMPVSDKVNSTADISAWLNYASVAGKMNSFRYLYRLLPSAKIYNPEHAIKGLNCDFYFENNKARIEQTVEYSEPMAKMVSKVMSRKPNKDIFKFFPSQEPLAYMTYNINTEEALKNYPKLAEQTLASLPFEKQDVEIVSELFTTLVDEEAAATLFDGDLSVFLHNVEMYDEKITETTYDDNYEEVTEEKTVTKTRPVFSFVMTSSHPTMANKLLELGVRKKVLVKENNYYVIQKSDAEFGTIILLKEGDAFVITNGLNYLNKGVKSDFIVKAKKEMAKNYMAGNLNIQNLIKSLMKTEGAAKDVEKLTKVSQQFKNLQFKSSKKLKDNKIKFEMEFNSNFNDKNIIIQSLDLFSYLN